MHIHRLVSALAVLGTLAAAALTASATAAPEGAARQNQAAVSVTGGTTQGLTEPLAVDVARPELAWTVGSSTAGSAVKAAEVEVRDAGADTDPIWSHVITDAGASAVTYNGPALAPKHRYQWRVRVQDQGNQWSAWSSSYDFGTAMFDTSDWSDADWITESAWQSANDELPSGLPLLRRDFTVEDRPIANATLFVSGLGAYVASVNGERAGDHQLGSGWTKFDKRTYYDGIDVTDSIQQGENTVGIALGQGFLNGLHEWTDPENRGAWDGIPRTKALLVVTYADGQTLSVPTDTEWSAAQGPSMPFTNTVIPESEGYDARRAQPGWDTPSFDDGDWAPAVPASNGEALLQANPVEPTRIVDRFPVDSPDSPDEGVYVYDVGKNVSGNVQITLDVPEGTAIRIRYAEKLSDGWAVVTHDRYQDDTFISDGSGPVTWTPSFTHKGFQYVEVSGLPSGTPAPAVTVLHMHNDLASIGTFDSSNDVLNFIHNAGRLTALNNLVVGAPTDGSYVEKLPWLGDGAVMSEAVSRNFDARRVYTKWFNDLADSQSAWGDMPAWAPAPTAGADHPSPAWGNAFTETALLLMNTYNADEAVADRYADLKEYATLMAANATNPTERWGDWVCPDGDDVCNTPEAKTLVARAYVYRTLQQFAQIATSLGHPEDAATATAQADAARDAFNNDYYAADSSSYWASGGAFLQTSNLLPVAFGIAPEDERQAIVDNIAADVVDRGNHLGTGVLGTKWLFRVLTQYGHLDTAYAAATNLEAPGYGYMMENGATTLWEDWTTSPRSLGHPFLGTAEDWLLADVAGLADPGSTSSEVIIKPHLPTGLNSASTTHETPGGTAGSSWNVDNGNLELTVDIPVSRTGTIYVPVTAGQSVIAPSGAVKEDSIEGYEVYTVSSGHYAFRTESGQ
ncbi:family 78 glycoside hydrolase catalytic domain [Streptomyces sp. 6N223]|uniref:family 78 glycoside hydrolase catalytic domain n=1 Tax=Streptomyces sp. 6N223 TaxID=3457412 RepID=UPI003FCFD070